VEAKARRPTDPEALLQWRKEAEAAGRRLRRGEYESEEQRLAVEAEGRRRRAEVEARLQRQEADARRLAQALVGLLGDAPVSDDGVFSII
jgi:hypothetical protein